MNKSFALTKLAEACVAQGAVATATEKELTVDGQELSFNVEIREALAKGNLYDRGPRKLLGHTVKVGAYGRRGTGSSTRLPQKSDGTHSWERGAEVLIALARLRNNEATRNAGVAANADTIEALRAELDVKSYWGPIQFEASSSQDKPVKIDVKFTTYGTPERAREIHAALAALGLLK